VFICKLDDGGPWRDRQVVEFVLDRGMAGLELSKPMGKMGLHSSPTGEVFVNDLRASSDQGSNATGTGLFPRASPLGRGITDHNTGAQLAPSWPSPSKTSRSPPRTTRISSASTLFQPTRTCDRPKTLAAVTGPQAQNVAFAVDGDADGKER
jgi:hypothetical protein